MPARQELGRHDVGAPPNGWGKGGEKQIGISNGRKSHSDSLAQSPVDHNLEVPKRCFGKPCIRGHRIWVSLILDMLASGTPKKGRLEASPSP